MQPYLRFLWRVQDASINIRHLTDDKTSLYEELVLVRACFCFSLKPARNGATRVHGATGFHCLHLYRAPWMGLGPGQGPTLGPAPTHQGTGPRSDLGEGVATGEGS